MSTTRTPKRFVHFRDITKLDLVASAGLTSPADLKIAHWRGCFDSAHVVPTDDFHTMSFVASGAVSRIDRPCARLGRGQVTLRPNTFAGVYTSEGITEYVTVYLRVDCLNEMAGALRLRPSPVELAPQQAARDPVLAKLIQTCALNLLRFTCDDRLALDGWAQVIGSHLIQTYGRTSRPARPAPPVMSARALNRVLEAIEENLDEDLSLARLAALVDMRRTTFCRSFKKAVGQSPHQYLIERRLARAQELMICAEDSLSEIALAVGFSSQAHMTSAFQNKLGVTPGQYRRHLSA